MLADFTNILLLIPPAMAIPSANWRVKPAHVYGGLEHRHWSGVELPVNSNASSAAPRRPGGIYQQFGAFLYSSRAESPLGEPEWGISQTPQV